jgi:hypothetical protein
MPNREDAIWTEHNGSRLVATDYWQSDMAANGFFVISGNAGVVHLLMPEAHRPRLHDMTMARNVVIRRGMYKPDPPKEAKDCLEVLFDDGTNEPFVLYLDTGQALRVPADSDSGRGFAFQVYVQAPDGTPEVVLERPCFYERVALLPDLRAWKGPRPLNQALLVNPRLRWRR